MDLSDFDSSYCFEFDQFQREAIGVLAGGSSVLVAAPTGSGKTVIAEYGIALALSQGKKYFYTTPMKALSNQKYRDLSAAYPPGDVGLLTGDNSINDGAPIVVMTTEVLRNMIYEKSPLLERLGVVVLDEVHFLRDPSRGAVWEEIVIQLDSEVKIISLSATVSNAGELGDWMNSLRGDVRIVVSERRPVELKNYYFVGRALVPLFSKKLHRIISEQTELVKAARAASRKKSKRKSVFKGLRPGRPAVVKELGKRDMLPAIYFLFSRAACDDSVCQVLEQTGPLTTQEESAKIEHYLDEKVSAVSAADLESLDYKVLRSGLTAGVAAHHAGILPLFKEAIEELFAGGYLKVVFATETLSLGINMPARTVVIESLSKWEGTKHRPLTPGEYRQLTGRAGRRGIDQIGYAVALYQRYFSLEHVRSLVKREPDPVVSSFKITYNMAVNLLAENDLEQAKKVLDLSLAQFVADKRVVILGTEIENSRREMEGELNSCCCEGVGDARAYLSIEREISRLQRKLSSLSKERRRRGTEKMADALRPGDVFLIGPPGSGRVVAVVKKKKNRQGERDILLVDSTGRFRRAGPKELENASPVLGTVETQKVASPSKKVRRTVGARMESLGARGATGREGGNPSGAERKLSFKIERLKEERRLSLCHSCGERAACIDSVRKAEKTGKKVRALEKEMESGRDVVSRGLLDVVGLLERFGYLEEGRPTSKGRMLSRVYNECDVLLVEALGRGLVDVLEPDELAVFASWLIYESRNGEQSPCTAETGEHPNDSLREAFEGTCGIHQEIRSIEEELGLELTGTPDHGFGRIAYMWAGGTELEEILYEFPEKPIGDFVRNMKQIIDLLRQMAGIAGSPELRAKLDEAMNRVDRGIVSHSSLESIIEHQDRVVGG